MHKAKGDARVGAPDGTGSRRLSLDEAVQRLPTFDADPNQDKRVTRTRELLVQAFLGLAFEKDFQSLTIQAITERAGINRATFYAHFEDKYALLAYCLRGLFHEMVENRLSDTNTLTQNNLGLLIDVVWEFLAQFHARCRWSTQSFVFLLQTQFQNLLYRFLVRWLTHQPAVAGTISPNMELTARVLSWTIFGLGIEQFREDQSQHTVAEITAHIFASIPHTLRDGNTA